MGDFNCDLEHYMHSKFGLLILLRLWDYNNKNGLKF